MFDALWSIGQYCFGIQSIQSDLIVKHFCCWLVVLFCFPRFIGGIGGVSGFEVACVLHCELTYRCCCDSIWRIVVAKGM